jgi:hypothetical protein
MVFMLRGKVCSVMTLCSSSVEPSGSAITYFGRQHEAEKGRYFVVLLFRFAVAIVGIPMKT